MPEWITSGWTSFVALGAAVAALVAFATNIDKLINGIKKLFKTIRERIEAPQKTLEAITQLKTDYALMRGDMSTIRETLAKQSSSIDNLKIQNGQQSESICRLEGSVADLKTRVTTVDKLVGNIMCSQLVQEHDDYMRLGYCPSADKMRLSSIYDEYKAQGRNHLVDCFMDDVMSLPEQKNE